MAETRPIRDASKIFFIAILRVYLCADVKDEQSAYRHFRFVQVWRDLSPSN
ncbi:hypothetical protein [Vibrio vulnificus YJ016]|uniref:Uncharacterized protein n=1 Tax=Vibrio vulnificus (strain YJ016) TaxID=196600 RepID=Q7MCV6_VIBVY|nr:hypothetical protein [Vibrio vulnificus YJ016]